MTTTTDAPHAPHRSHSGKWILLILVLAIIAIGATWYSGAFDHKPRLAIITANQGAYWDLLLKGAQDAAAKEDVDLDVMRSNGDEDGQTKAIVTATDEKYDGVAVSPNNPNDQAQTLLALASKTNLITFDSDCPIANRLCFIGTDDYDAGRMCGQYLKKILPDGGDVAICVGSTEKENGQRRRQGVIDELLERSFEPTRSMDAIDAPLKGPKFTVVATLVDKIDPQKATTMAGEAIDKFPKLSAFVGLYAYNTPAILHALDQKHKTDQIKVIAFDFNPETLDGIDSGRVYATMVQDAYLIGFETTRILAEVARGNRGQLPMFQVRRLACDAVTKENLPALRQKLPRTAAPTTNPT